MERLGEFECSDQGENQNQSEADDQDIGVAEVVGPWKKDGLSSGVVYAGHDMVQDVQSCVVD